MSAFGKRSTLPVEVLWCSNQRTRAGNGWAFPPAVRNRLQTDCRGRSVLHLFGGLASFGVRLDIDPAVLPDVIGDAWLPPFGRDSFDVVILDPPYTHLNAQVKTALFRAAAWIARERVIWFPTLWASAAGGLTWEQAWLVRVGDSCYVRCLQYFRVVRKLGPVAHFNRGPALRYNRWLAQPSALPLWPAEASVAGEGR